ncbi:hypothetical protein BDZ94DRAFT_1270016 [Collybia nuda]|uniref:Nudix hydrolase domain-containing protein n=1 Tax=Collybia nuda TaxID=64659 RepID=A0A9P6CF52_9AGAR|nr:hypothetical protein BDZ94DRAFT_1270016 [Collybia nuda]
MLGAGMVILQPSTDKVVVLHEKEDKYWFFPKGRKDIGESLETTAIREAYEESGFRATFLPLYTNTRAPAPPDDKLRALRKNTEPVFLSLMSWRARSTHPHRERPAGEYLTTWYVGQIPEDAEYRPDTGMPDEQNFESYLLTYEEAMERLDNPYRDVLQYVWAIYTHTLYLDHLDETRELQDEQRRSINRVSQKLPQEQTRRRSHQ